MLKIEMKESADQVTYFLAGELNETGELPQLAETTKKIFFDLSGLTVINSIGVLKWLRWLPGKPEIKLQNCPAHLIHQMCIVPAMVTPKASIESLYVPLFCEKCDKEDFKRVTVKECKAMGKEQVLQPVECRDSACAMMPDFDPARYSRII